MHIDEIIANITIRHGDNVITTKSLDDVEAVLRGKKIRMVHEIVYVTVTKKAMLEAIADIARFDYNVDINALDFSAYVRITR